jgi:hypothetical protein
MSTAFRGLIGSVCGHVSIRCGRGLAGCGSVRTWVAGAYRPASRVRPKGNDSKIRPNYELRWPCGPQLMRSKIYRAPGGFPLFFFFWGGAQISTFQPHIHFSNAWRHCMSCPPFYAQEISAYVRRVISCRTFCLCFDCCGPFDHCRHSGIFW